MGASEVSRKLASSTLGRPEAWTVPNRTTGLGRASILFLCQTRRNTVPRAPLNGRWGSCTL